MKRHGATGRAQRGMVLVVSLVFLLVLTILGLAAIQNTSLEERMAGNLRSENVALQAAEAALRGGELWLARETPTLARKVKPTLTTSKPGAPSANEVWRLDRPIVGTVPWWRNVAATAAWWGANAIEVPVGDLVVADQPRYVIEYLGRFPGDINLSVPGQPADFFQVTARGVAPGGRGEALLRSTYAGYYAY